MAYLVLARKWRPRRFNDLIGQSHVATTLINAIKSGRVAHAFLFTGARGVGKTSAARILSMALNCEAYKDATPDPCGECETCLRIISGTCVDVHEIDGASNNSVDDIRNLRETVAYTPAVCRNKIYIIDEVHMLTQSAFNALLKTLEEPPPHVKFIFATTEPHRIPVTILSRCQRFDFRKIPTILIEKQIQNIASSENIRMEQAAVTMIAREADGSMRDALSILDQIIAATGSTVTSTDVQEILGISGPEVSINLSKAIINGDVKSCLQIIQKLDNEGINLPRFFEGYLSHIRDMILIKAAGKEVPCISLSSWEIDAIVEMVKRVELSELYRIFTNIFRAVEISRHVPFPKIMFEISVVRLAVGEPLTSMEKVLTKLGQLARESGMQGKEFIQRRQSDENRNGRAPDYGAGQTNHHVKINEECNFIEKDNLKKEKWQNIIDIIHNERPALAEVLSRCILIELEDNRIKIGFPPGSFECNFLQDKENRIALNEIIERITGKKHEIVLIDGSTEALEHKKKELNRFKKTAEEARCHPAVLQIMKVLNAKILDIKTDLE